MVPPHLVILVATLVLSGCAWLGLGQRIQGLEVSSVGSPAISDERADLVLATHERPITTVPMQSRTLLAGADLRDSVLLLLIGASLLTLAAGMRRYGAALADLSAARARVASPHPGAARTNSR